jgi:hypothetical protein
LNAGIEGLSISCLTPYNGDLFAGTRGGGVFLLRSGDSVWAAVNEGLGDLVIGSLAVSGTDLLAGAGVDGVWKRPLPELPASVSAPRSDLPQGIELAQNYPNPFNPSTRIRYTITNREHVTLNIYNMLGQLVATLVNADMLPGTYETTFDAGFLTSGVYMYRLQTATAGLTQKMMLLK